MEDLHRLSATDALRLICEGSISSVELVKACLARIESREPDIGAWEYLNPAQALSQARARDAVTAEERSELPLHGIPVAIKDICDTEDMPTGYGSRARVGHRPAIDAVCVALTRSAGAVILGKTVTTEFAGRLAGVTANPHDVRRTPGGSSSGSAAAVADFMVPLAVGTQTGGSIIRPAAYCGIIGYKPTFGHTSFEGVHHGAETFDTLGCMARSLQDIELYRSVLMGFRRPKVASATKTGSFRVGFCRTARWKEADDATRTCLTLASTRLRGAGAEVVELALPSEFDAIYDLVPSIFAVEYARSVAPERNRYPDNLSSAVTQMIIDASRITEDAYVNMLEKLDALRDGIGNLINQFDFILTPSAVGEASLGHVDTGPITFNVVWQALNLPCVTLPRFTGPAGMPIGVQLIGKRHRDSELLSAAKWVSGVL